MTKSPGRMIVFSPSTAVYAPLPSTMKRKRGLRMAVGRSDLARQDQLQARIERVGYAGTGPAGRGFEDQHAPLGFLRRDDAAGFHHEAASTAS
jgi:hypothetical protein